MLNKIIRFSIYNKGLTFIFTALLAVAGWISFRALPIDVVPDITNVQVQVNTAVNGLIPEEIEKFITYPIESEMGGMPGVEQIRSISRFGLSQVTVIFKEDTGIYLARQLVSEKLQAIKDELPLGVEPKLGPMTTGLGEIYFYSIEAKKPAQGQTRLKQLMELRTLNEWVIQPRLRLVDGVAEVNAIGGFEKQYYIKPHPRALAKYGITLGDVTEAVRKNNRNTGGGYIQQTAEQLLIQAKGILQSEDDIRAIVVKKLPDLMTVTIGEIADVSLDKELRTGAALIDGKEEIVGTVLMLLGANSRTVSESIDQKMKDIRKSLPDWVELKTLYNRSTLVDRTLSTVEENLIFGAFLVALVLFLIIGNLRVALIAAVTIPLSLLATFILMKRFGISGNLMSLGALDFGVIIDGAVIVIDNCVRFISLKCKQLGRPLTREEVRSEVYAATSEVSVAASFGQMIILVVFLPIFALTGVEAKMFGPMAAAFCFAVVGAYIFSFTTIPALAGALLPGNISQIEPWIMRNLESLYSALMERVLKAKSLVVGLGALAIVTGAVLFSFLGADFLPQLDEGAIAIQFIRPTNISVDQAVEMEKLSEKVILTFPEVERIVSRMGTAEVATDPMGVNTSDTYIFLKDKSNWPEHSGKKFTKNELIAAIKGKLGRLIPGQGMEISQPIQLRFNELLEGVRADVSLKIFGEDMDKLAETARQAADIIKRVPGAGDVETEIRGKSPVLRIEPKVSELKRLGLAKDNLLTTVETAIGGTKVGSLYQGITRFPIVVRFADKDRSTLSSIASIPVGVGENFTMPLGELADIKVDQTFGEIKRDSAKERVAVLINLRGRDTDSFVEQAQVEIEQKLKLPTGYYLEWGGSFKNLASAKERLMIVVPLALLLVFMMTFMAFRSVTQAAIIFVCVPMALVGGVLGLMLNHLNFSISAAVGFIALSGVSVLNGIVLVSYFDKLKLEGLSGDSLIMKGAKMRLRAVLMASMAAALGFIPMMISTGNGAEVQRPLASVVVGGLVSSTLLTLVVLPVLYRIFESKMKVFKSSMSH